MAAALASELKIDGSRRSLQTNASGAPANPSSFGSPAAIKRLKARRSALAAATRSPASSRRSIAIRSTSITEPPRSGVLAEAPSVVIERDAGEADADDEYRVANFEDQEYGEVPYPRDSTRDTSPRVSGDLAMRFYNTSMLEKDKENLQTRTAVREEPRFFNAPQANATRIQFDDDDDDDESRAAAEEDEEMPDSEATTQLASERSHSRYYTAMDHQRQQSVDSEEEEEFQEDTRPINPSRRQAAPTAAAAPRLQAQKLSAQPRSRLRDAPPAPATPQDVHHEYEPQPGPSQTRQKTRDISDDFVSRDPLIMELHEEALAAHPPHRQRKPQIRRAWSAEATATLIKAIEATSSYALIHKKNLPALAGRDQIAIRDKAQNIKIDLLRRGKPLPRGFDQVRLTKKQISLLADRGVVVNQSWDSES